MEAMACGVPIIATNSGGVPEIVRHGQDGFLVTPGSADEIANAMVEILKNDGLRRRLSDSALKRAESFDLNILVDKMTNIFERTIKT